MITIRELTTEADWTKAIEVLSELRSEAKDANILNERESLMQRGYKMYGLFEAETLVCMAGIILQPHITRKNDFWVHDLVTLEAARSKGYGEQIMRFLEQEARKLGCSRLSVHTRTNRDRAQNFYQNHLGYDRYAIVFQQDLK